MIYQINNQKIGKHLRELIEEKYGTQREFCRKWLELRGEDATLEQNAANRLSQMIHGERGVQLDDFPYFTYQPLR